MPILSPFLHLLGLFFLAGGANGFVIKSTDVQIQARPTINNQNSISFSIARTLTLLFAEQDKQTVALSTELNDERVTTLFAWVSRAFLGDPRYNNLMLAIAAIFGDLPENSDPALLAKEALRSAPQEEELCGDPISLGNREYASLGAMGAAQWTGQWKTRPHALLEIGKFQHVDDWVATLPRGCRRTIKKALQQNFTVAHRPIMGGQPAPHSSLAHFRCVVAHEVRLLSWGAEGFFDALGEAINRYVGTTRMTGEIREYRNVNNEVIAIAHEVRKGTTVRGQWFYANDEAAKQYVWFHSVYDLVRRSIESDGVDVVDLGPSGSDSFSELKARYGFRSVDDWPAVANYEGDFWYEGDEARQPKTSLASLFDIISGNSDIK